jgi:hypothetical protein
MKNDSDIEKLKNYLEKRIKNKLRDLHASYFVKIEKNSYNKLWRIKVYPVINERQNVEFGYCALEDILGENNVIKMLGEFTVDELNNYITLLKMKGEI